jgi:predicted site-specific integrase-resolvase
MPDSKEILTGWKAIAEYLGISVDTARKWHREKGMPVITQLGLKVALVDELKKWLKNQS